MGNEVQPGAASSIRRHVAVGAVLSGKQIAVWSPGKVEGVARALCEDVSGVAQGIGVVWQEKIRAVAGKRKIFAVNATSRVLGKTPPTSSTSPWSVLEPLLR